MTTRFHAMGYGRYLVAHNERLIGVVKYDYNGSLWEVAERKETVPVTYDPLPGFFDTRIHAANALIEHLNGKKQASPSLQES